MIQIADEKRTEPMNENPAEKHIPVLLNEVLEYLDLKEGGLYVDGTLGMGGHAQAILEGIGDNGQLIGLDRDDRAIALAKRRLAKFDGQCTFCHDNFYHLNRVLQDLDIDSVDGILLDLGISSFQMDDPDRGFSIRNDGPLDMRMNPQAQITAFDLINSLSEKEIAHILRDYGEERFSGRIARHIVNARVEKPIETTNELSQIVLRAMPFSKKPKGERIHPATRTFQALRIAVNRELEALEQFLQFGVDFLKPGGRLAIISFHSLEDRKVKITFRQMAKDGQVKLILKKPVFASDEETSQNKRARSARLRVVEKI